MVMLLVELDLLAIITEVYKHVVTYSSTESWSEVVKIDFSVCKCQGPSGRLDKDKTSLG
jgi:hypothetical protein